MKKYAIFLFSFFLLLSGCAPSGTVDLMEEIPARVVCPAQVPEVAVQAADFGIRLFQAGMKEGENTLISPLSVLSALAMTANGADGETLAQMEATLGMSAGDMNAFLCSYLDSQPETLKLANSIWLTDAESFSVNRDFLETNASFYGADIFRTPMDSSTTAAINRWVMEKTDGMIPEILDKLPQNPVVYLVNALAFEAQWEQVYKEHNVQAHTFTAGDGTAQPVEIMYSQERHYLQDEKATGFLKYYAGGDYAFAALLPNEGISIGEYVRSLTGEGLHALLTNPEAVTVSAGIPKFEAQFDAQLSGVLSEMGMTHAFDAGLADFSRLGSSGEGNIFISRVLHRTCLSVAEQGTKVGAATAVEMPAAGAYREEDIRFVTLDRPFVYMLIDCRQNLPLFIGTLVDVE